MSSQTLEFMLVGWLAVAFVAAAASDWRTRTISNPLNLTIALGAPFFWVAQGLMWDEIAVSAGVAVFVFVIFMIPFAIGQMGGGDLKLIGAASLWFPLADLNRFLIAMCCVGGVLTLLFFIRHKMAKAEGRAMTPYGIAISMAGLWVISERYLNHFL